MQLLSSRNNKIIGFSTNTVLCQVLLHAVHKLRKSVQGVWNWLTRSRGKKKKKKDMNNSCQMQVKNEDEERIIPHLEKEWEWLKQQEALARLDAEFEIVDWKKLAQTMLDFPLGSDHQHYHAFLLFHFLGETDQDYSTVDNKINYLSALYKKDSYCTFEKINVYPTQGLQLM